MAKKNEKWKRSMVCKGYMQVELSSWQAFMEYIYEQMLNYSAYVWRGQRCSSWKLESTYQRLMQKKSKNKTDAILQLSQHLNQFKYAVRGRRGANPPKLDTDNDWWAIGQHHGLATPLLDWTGSPFAAAYFAFAEHGNRPTQTRQRAVYALHRPTIETVVRKLVKETKVENKKKREEIEASSTPNTLAALLYTIDPEPEIEFFRPMSDENNRLVNQDGLFTNGPKQSSIEEWVQKNPADDDGLTLIKILIPNRDRHYCLRTLNRMNINHLTLFPDLYGASTYCNVYREIERY